MIRVGRCVYDSAGNKYDPTFDNFVNIVVVMKSHSPYYELSPYYLKDEKNRIMENYWQFSKIYETVPITHQRKSRYDQTIIWTHPAEVHIVKENNVDKITDEYRNWRNKGMLCQEPIRYPVGYHYRGNCVGALNYKINPETGNEEIDDSRYLNYVESRKEIYVKKYCELVKQHPMFLQLKQRLASGENLLIVDVDGPHQESLEYYKATYGVGDDFLENRSVLINQRSIQILLNDTKHPFGHGYCLAMALLDKDVEWNI